MGKGFSPDEEALYFKTGEAVRKRLQATPEPERALAILAVAQDRFARAFDQAPAKARARIACHAGCDTCCHEDVAVQAHEVLIAAEYAQRNFTAAALEAVIARAATHRAAHAARREGGPLPRTPCPLLHEGNCSVYPARPEACRAHHSHSVAACKTNLAAGAPVIDVAVAGVRGRMFAVMLAIDQAAEDEGFDDQAYDLGSALHEALTNSLCAVRWQRHEAAFPADCREF
ncbi:YkgJ family cysteine cluster protein [Horticoccus luteus]|uniref:YkgJ family cysteine cluster protein n=1 Tax=Horticoccus luteus TaxID=2862869 RepID=A0A8F9XL83_9BACT|nr:YkgJ family cysteine cluster protein [Horticoccus luteus]QYM80438.1 YkgJ family cysteine cluster protein [Horticoccus luteus]